MSGIVLGKLQILIILSIYITFRAMINSLGLKGLDVGEEPISLINALLNLIEFVDFLKLAPDSSGQIKVHLAISSPVIGLKEAHPSQLVGREPGSK